MNRYKTFTLTLAAICFSLSPAFASTFSQIAASATEIEYLPFAEIGELATTSHVYKDENQKERYVGAYKITLNEGETVEILLGSDYYSELDTYLYVLDEDGNYVTHDDDDDENEGYGNSVNVDGEYFPLGSYIKFSSSGGVFYILASTFEEYDNEDYPTTGNYAIEVRKEIRVADFSEIAASAKNIGSLPFAEIDELTATSPVYPDESYYHYEARKYVGAYKITLTEGKIIEILLGGANGYLDTYLYILDENGNLVLSDDDRGSGKLINVDGEEYDANSLIRLSRNGVYYILASTLSELTEGSYAIEVKEFVPPAFIASPTEISAPFAAIDQLTATSPVYDDWYYVKAYKITLDEGETIDILLGGADNLDTYLNVVDEFGDNVTGDDDYGRGMSINVDGEEYDANSYVRLSGSGVYYILASIYGNRETGSYAIEVKYPYTAKNFSDLIASATEISVPFAGTGQLTATSPVHEDEYYELDRYTKAYKVTLSSETIEILLGGTNGYFDTYLYVLDGNGNIVRSADEGGYGKSINVDGEEYDANSYVRLSGSGVYYILASSFSNRTAGSYAIEVKTYVDPSPIISNNVIPSISSQKAWMQNGTLHMSGLTVGKAWSVYTAKGTLVHQGIANSTEMNVNLNMTSGVYFVRSNGQTLRIINK